MVAMHRPILLVEHLLHLGVPLQLLAAPLVLERLVLERRMLSEEVPRGDSVQQLAQLQILSAGQLHSLLASARQLGMLLVCIIAYKCLFVFMSSCSY